MENPPKFLPNLFISYTILPLSFLKIPEYPNAVQNLWNMGIIFENLGGTMVSLQELEFIDIVKQTFYMFYILVSHTSKLVYGTPPKKNPFKLSIMR